MRAAARCLMVAVTICAWLALSNHCVIAALSTKTQSAQSGCPFHSKPAKPQPQSVQCCKILRAVSNAPVKNCSPAIVDLPDVDLANTVLEIFAQPKISFLPETHETGPPGKTSFLELNRSLRAHAPPFLA